MPTFGAQATVHAMDDSEVKPYRENGFVGPNHMSFFWGYPNKWPGDSAGYVFLARAVHRLGREIFGAEWIGDEPATPPLPPLEYFGRGVSTNQLMFSILERFGGARYQAIKPVDGDEKPSTYGIWPLSPGPTAEHRELFQEIYEARRDEAHARELRLVKVRQTIERACRDGKLRTFVRPIEGGQPVPLDPVVWNTERTYARWCECKMDPNDPFGLGSTSARHWWVFLEEEGLSKLLNSSSDVVIPKQKKNISRKDYPYFIRELGPKFERYVKTVRRHPQKPRPTVACDRAVIRSLAGRHLPDALCDEIRQGRVPPEWQEPGDPRRIGFDALRGLTPPIVVEKI